MPWQRWRRARANHGVRPNHHPFRRVLLIAWIVLGALVLNLLPPRVWLTPLVAPLALVEASRELGLAAPRCLAARPLAYDPRNGGHADRAFVADPPEGTAVAALAAPGRTVAIEWVQLDYRDTLAIVWARVREADGREEVREVRLRAGAQIVSLDLPWQEMMICNKNLGGWRVVPDRP